MSKVTDVSLEVLNKAIKLTEVRDRLRDEYISKIEALTEEEWKTIKSMPKFIFRKFSIIRLVPMFRFTSPIQKAGSEEESKLTFIDVQRILCYLLLGNDFVGKWDNTVEAGFGEPLYKEIIEKIKSVAKDNDYDAYTAYFVVEKMAQKGDYTLKIVKRREGDDSNDDDSDDEDKVNADHKPKTYASAVGKSKKGKETSIKTDKVSKPLNKEHSKPLKAQQPDVPVGRCIEAETMDPMLVALDAMAKLRGKEIKSRGERTMMAIKLCQMACNLLENNKA
jgi:hypothetical protein